MAEKIVSSPSLNRLILKTRTEIGDEVTARVNLGKEVRANKTAIELLNGEVNIEGSVKNTIEQRISKLSTISFFVVDSLPSVEEAQNNVFYLINNVHRPEIYDLWVVSEGVWVQTGSSNVDLSDYPTFTDLQKELLKKEDTLTWDTAPVNDSTNPVTSGGLKTSFDGVSTAIDNLKTYVDAQDLLKEDKLTWDNEPTASSVNPVRSGGIRSAILTREPKLTWDSVPTQNSANPVTSSGILQALNLRQPKILEESIDVDSTTYTTVESVIKALRDRKTFTFIAFTNTEIDALFA